ncbi:hypothetical protein COOONC_10396 [Cooperia oncophora]
MIVQENGSSEFESGFCKRWFEEARSVLILGDGNLSFSRTVAESEPDLPITATPSFWLVMDTTGIYNGLRQCDNVQLLFGIDATALPSDWTGKFHYIVMNFPHPGGKTNLRRSRLLASGIFRSVGSIMTDDSEFHLTLAQGQSGVQYCGGSKWSSHVPVHEKDSWQALYLAAEEETFDGYISSGYRSSAKGFNNSKGAQRLGLQEICSSGMFGQSLRHGMPYFYHDISFLFTDGNIDEGERVALELLRVKLTGSAVVEFKVENAIDDLSTHLASSRSCCGKASMQRTPGGVTGENPGNYTRKECVIFSLNIRSL